MSLEVSFKAHISSGMLSHLLHMSLITSKIENHHVYNVSSKVVLSSFGHSLSCAILLSMLGTACRGHFLMWQLTAVGERRLALACPSDKSCLTIQQHPLGPSFSSPCGASRCPLPDCLLSPYCILFYRWTASNQVCLA